MKEKDAQIAVLIDADNVSALHIEAIMNEVAKYGITTIKRIYADWTKPHLGSWKPTLSEYAISPIQQFSYTTGKNATDSALIIDAMDMLYTSSVDIFFLVSSDSDFTKLALRLRESGKNVYGIGEMKTPKALISACNRFFYIETLLEKEEKDFFDHYLESFSDGEENEKAFTPQEELLKEMSTEEKAFSLKNFKKLEKTQRLNGEIKEIGKKRALQKIKPLLLKTVEDVADEEGWAFLGEVGNLLLKKSPAFDPRLYGYKKLSDLIFSIEELECSVRIAGTELNPSIKHVFVRVK